MKTGAFLVSALLALSSSVASAQTFTLKISSPTVNDTTQAWMSDFKSAVESRSAGKIKVEMYPANQLGQIPATVEGVAMGTIEVVAPASGFLMGLEPRFQVFDAPGLFPSLAAAQKTFADPEVRKRLAEYGASKGMEPIAVLIHGPQMLINARPIRKVEDFKGQKIRVPGAAPLQIEPFRKLGAAPISMPLGEVLSALQNKTLDGSVSSATVFTAFKYYDVAKPVTELPGSFLIVPTMINKDFLKSLGPQLEAIVREEALNAQRKSEKFAVDDLANMEVVWKQNGGEIIRLDDGEKAKYLAVVTETLPAVLKANAKMQADYDLLVATVAKVK